MKTCVRLWLGAAALITAPAAHAATFTRIELLTSGTGVNMAIGVQTVLRDLTFTYFVPPADDPAVTSTPDSLAFAGDPFLFSPAFTRLTATSTAFLVSQGTANSGFIATACYTAPGAAVLPTKGFLTDPGCSSASLNTISHGSETRYTGTVTEVRISQFDQAPAQIGLVSIASAVPEPSTWALMLAGFGVAAFQLRRRSARLLVA